MDLEKIIQEKKNGKNLNEQSSNQDHEKKLLNMQYQNDLLMERMKQITEMNESMKKTNDSLFQIQMTNLNTITENYQKKMNEQLQENEEKQENVMREWKCKANEIKESNILLEKSFNNAINNEFENVLSLIESETVKSINQIKQASTLFSDEAVIERKKSLGAFEEEYQILLNNLKSEAAQMNEEYNKSLKALNDTTHEIIEKQNRNNHIFENGKFIFSNLIMVALGVIIIRALFYGVWEGLYISNFYEFASQWDWLKYTLWGVFAIVIGGIGYFIYLFLKNNLDRY